MSFEALWEQCEAFHQSSLSKSDAEANMDELAMKITLYKTLSSKKDMRPEDMRAIKKRVMGEILFALTKLSDNDDVNTYTALKEALDYNSLNRIMG